mmetsp:Transcript_45149/g.96407  ORF Transcript_45149/g.96407 Transcript_45149/m.96407 type:complete len:119 (+) Transcript_45149:336-692(+)
MRPLWRRGCGPSRRLSGAVVESRGRFAAAVAAVGPPLPWARAAETARWQGQRAEEKQMPRHSAGRPGREWRAAGTLSRTPCCAALRCFGGELRPVTDYFKTGAKSKMQCSASASLQTM